MKKRELTEQGRKLSTTDENILKSAEKLVEDEFSYVLDIPQSDVGRYIRNLLHVSDEDE